MALAATMAQGVAPISVPHPIKTVYIDWRDINWNAPDQTVTSAVDGGFNVVVLAFFMGGAATDMLQVRVWACSVAGPRCVRQARGCHCPGSSSGRETWAGDPNVVLHGIAARF